MWLFFGELALSECDMNEWWLIGCLVLMTLMVTSVMIYPFRKNVVAVILSAVFVWMIAFFGYNQWGGFTLWKDHLNQVKSQALAQNMLKSIKSPQEIIDKILARLEKEPNSAKGWFLLGRLYASQNNSKKAFDAFARAHQLDPNQEQYTVYYAQSLWQFNHHQLNAEIKDLFLKLLQKNPRQPDALAMLAMASYQTQAYEEAIYYWQQLLSIVSPKSEEAEAIRKAIAKAEAQISKRSSKTPQVRHSPNGQSSAMI